MSFVRQLKLLRSAAFAFSLLYAALFASSSILLGSIVYWTVQSSLDRQLTARIESEVELLKQILRSEGAVGLEKEVQERGSYAGNLNYFLVDAGGNKLAGSLQGAPKKIGWSDFRTPGGQYKDYLVKTVVLENGFRLSVADDLGTVQDVRRAFLEAMGWTAAAFLVLSVACGPLISALFLKRVQAVTRTAADIIRGKLDSRIPLRGTGDEFDDLSTSLNQMLDRIQILMESLNQVSNDIAHALRTPLGRLRQTLEEAQASVDGNSKGEQAIEAALLESDKILDTFSALLRIAQIESGTRTAGFCSFELSRVFETVVDAYSAVADEEGKALTAQIVPGVKYCGDPDLISEMLANLLDNAMRHTPVGTKVEVSLELRDRKLMAAVSDNGSGIHESEQQRIFRRFYRAERSRNTRGSGLGLALVSAVAELHGIRLSVEDNVPGLRMTMTFDGHPLYVDGRGWSDSIHASAS